MSTPHLTGTLPYQDASDMYHQYTAYAHQLWTTFGGVSLAVLACMLYLAHYDEMAAVSGVLVISYVLFAASNLAVVRTAQMKCVAFASVLNRSARTSGAGNSPNTVACASVQDVTAAHVSATLLVLLSIAAVGWG